MDDSLTVSVIIPTFNRLDYFKKALDSALKQTYKNIEVVVTDDSSIDQIEKFVKTMGDNRIRYYRNQKRLGTALNIKSGIMKSSGQYFAFLNDDDFWCDTFLEKLVSLIKMQDKIGCAFSDHWLVNSDGEFLIEETEINSISFKRNKLAPGIIKPDKRVDLFVDFTVPVAMASIIRREAVDMNEYPIEIGGAYDRWLLLQCTIRDDFNFLYLNEKLTCYRVHNQSVSATQAVNIAKSVIYILIRSLSMLKYERKQKARINKSIRAYIRSLVKRRSLMSFSYIPIYLSSFFR